MEIAVCVLFTVAIGLSFIISLDEIDGLSELVISVVIAGVSIFFMWSDFLVGLIIISSVTVFGKLHTIVKN